MKANVYDFDKTIFSKDSSVEFYKFCLKKKPSILKYIFVQLFYFVLYIFNFIDKTKFKEHVFVFLKAFDNIDDLVKEFWQENKKMIYSWYAKKHQDSDIIISASPYFLLKPICDELGIKNLIASEVDSKTGKFLSPNCYGEEKVNRLKQFGEVEIGEFYSDSFSDQPLADLASDAFIIKHNAIHKWNKYKPTFSDKVKKHFFTKEFLAFLVVGAINVFNGVWISYLFSLFLSPVLAFFVGYAISLTISYFLNSLLVFKSKLHIMKYLKFCLSYVPNFLIQNGLILIFYYGLHLNKLLVYILAAIIAIPITFLVLSLVTFAKNKEGKDASIKDIIDVPSICFNCAALIIMTIATDIFLCTAAFLTRSIITWYQLPLSFVVSSAILFVFSGRKKPLAFVIEVSTVLVIFVGFAALMGKFYDPSYDGNSYHKYAVGLLRRGWNPIYEIPDGQVTMRIFGLVLENDIWIEGYCKGTWYFGASVYAITDNIETAKCYNIILLVAVLLGTYGAYRKRIDNPLIALGLAFVTAFNPVLVSQLFTFYIDGALYAVLTLLIAYLLIWLLDDKSNHIYIFILIGCAMVICGNIKFTGLLFGGCFCILNYLVYAARVFINNRQVLSKKECLFKVMPSFFVFVGIAIATVLWVGSSSYITNLIRHQTLGYPITGPGAVDIITNNSPFAPDSNYLVNVFMSLFAKADNFAFSSGQQAILKMPFSITSEELKMVKESCDLRLSGFGLLFSGVVIIAIVVFVYTCIVSKKSFENLLLLLNFVLCLIFILAIKESWWARYAPYAYIALILTLYTAFKDSTFKSPLFYIALLCLLVLIVNDSLTLSNISFNIEYSTKLAQAYADVKAQATSIFVYNQIFKGNYFNLIDQGFKIYIDSYLPNKTTNTIGSTGTYWMPI